MSAATLSSLSLATYLESVAVWPRRILLDRCQGPLPLPTLRGVWGAVLRDLDKAVYQRVFSPSPPDVPRYLLRPAPASQVGVDWYVFGDNCSDDLLLRRAWDVAGGRGLGRERQPFLVRSFVDLDPNGRVTAAHGPWPLARALWPISAKEPCQLRFSAPLRLIRNGQLVLRPSFPDIAIAAHRRIGAFLPAEHHEGWRALQPEILDEARRWPNFWKGKGCDLHRYSARQDQDLELRGVCGILDLPSGVGPLAPLLAAAIWLHIGKGTVFGLGKIEIVF